MTPTPIPAIEYLSVVKWLVGYVLAVLLAARLVRRARPVSLGAQGERMGREDKGDQVHG